MPIHGYPGNVITANPTAPTPTSASGVWTTEQQLINQSAGRWPPPYYLISRSLRFNSADSAYLNRTPASASNRRTFTWSGWVKRSGLGTQQEVFHAYIDGSNFTSVRLNADDTISVFNVISGSTSNGFAAQTSAVFRDVSAWYHFVFFVDTTQSTVGNAVKIYVNNVQQTLGSSSYGGGTNQNTAVNSTVVHEISRKGVDGNVNFVNGYMTEINFIDGQALTPSSFGQNDPNTGVWSPIKYTGTYGTNGFYLNFSDNSNTTAATLGKDYSGNGNNWTPNNFSVTAGAGNDSLVDTPTSYGTDTGAGGEVRGNYATLSPVSSSSLMTLANGNLDVTSGTTAANGNAYSTISPLTGKFYAEVRVNTGSNADMIGVCPNTLSNSSGRFDTLAGGIGYYYDGQKYVAGVVSNYGSSYTTNDVIGIALDMDAQTVTFYKNNVSQGTISSSMTANVGYYFVSSDASSGNGINHTWNFGQRAFAYTAPSGFKALCTQNLPTPTIGATSTTQANDYFNVVLWTGNGSDPRNITGVGFAPDFVWGKSRSSAYNHRLYDIVRGAQKALLSNATDAETTADDTMTAFLSDGFTVKNSLNTNADTYVSWNWNAGGSNATNTAGSITSTVRANTTSGFSIVTYTGNGTAGATVGHGLGVAPSMVMFKDRSSAVAWIVYHTSLGSNTYLTLNNTTAGATATGFCTPSSSTITFTNTYGNTNTNGDTYVAYCFAPVAGYSAFGSYTGNGSADGPFVYLGFRPEFVMIKNTTTAGTSWEMFDAAREPANLVDLELLANSSGAEGTYTFGDFVSNGFKLRSTNNGVNQSTATLVYMAFAENPFKYALAR